MDQWIDGWMDGQKDIPSARMKRNIDQNKCERFFCTKDRQTEGQMVGSRLYMKCKKISKKDHGGR